MIAKYEAFIVCLLQVGILKARYDRICVESAVKL